MQQQKIKVVEAYESKTNPRGNNFKGQAFKDLVASIKEKGVLVPVLARLTGSIGKEPHIEIIAGSRRFRAAKAVGLEEIPAYIVEMTDDEAREAQIIENLQRQDVHPLEEAEAYSHMIKTTADIKAVAAKVGKSESYIHNRIMLCNLAEEVKQAYREGEVNDGHAVEIARLSPGGDQQKTLTHIKQETSFGRSLPVRLLSTWIEITFFNELAFQPWLKDKEAMAAVGLCKECPPETNTLFGEVKEGACSTTRCHKRKMQKYIQWMKEKTPGLILVSTEYGSRPGMISEYDYELVAKGTKNSKPGLIVHGKNRGKLITVLVKNQPVNQMTPEEKAAHEKKMKLEREAEKKKQEAETTRENRKMEETLKNITWPLKEKHLAPLFTILTEHADGLDDIAKRRKLEGKRDEEGDYENVHETIKNCFGASDPLTKMQMIVEVALMQMWSGNDRSQMMKKFN